LILTNEVQEEMQADATEGRWARPVGCAVRLFFPRNEWRYQICK